MRPGRSLGGAEGGVKGAHQLQHFGDGRRGRKSTVAVPDLSDEEGPVTRAGLRKCAAIQWERYERATRAEKHRLLDEVV